MSRDGYGRWHPDPVTPVTPKVNDRVRVTGEGRVVISGRSDGYIDVRFDGAKYSNALDCRSVTIEVLPPPEPEYVVGAWYLLPGGDRVVRYDGGIGLHRWWSPTSDDHVHLGEHTRRSLVRLIPEGQS